MPASTSLVGSVSYTDAPVLLTETHAQLNTAELTRVHTSTILNPAPQLQELFDCPSMHFLHPIILLLLPILALTMSTPTPITRIATFRFKPSVTAEQKGDRARAFLDLYAQHQDLICGMPKGGKPLDTPLELTGVKRDKVWDMGFRVVFKVGFSWRHGCWRIGQGGCLDCWDWDLGWC